MDLTKGTIRSDVPYHLVSRDVRRHRLISISYISQILCHSTAGWYGMEREGVGGNRKESDTPCYAGAEFSWLDACLSRRRPRVRVPSLPPAFPGGLRPTN